MKNNLDLAIPQTAVWLLRLAVTPSLARILHKDARAFATWYAAVESVIDWPEPVIQIRETERTRSLLIKHLSPVNDTFSGRASAEHARLEMAGHAVHEWVHRNTEEFTSVAVKAHDALCGVPPTCVAAPDTLSPLAARVRELADCIKLAPLERDILSFALLTTVSQELSSLFEQFAADRWTARALWTALFDTSAEELTNAMRPCSPLRLSGLLQVTGYRAELSRVPDFWVEILTSADSLTDALLEPLGDEVSSRRPARLLEEDRALAVRLLKHAGEPGVNLLLYGDASLEKRQLLRDIVAGAARTLWRTRRIEDVPREALPSLTFVAFQLLAAKDPTATLVIERPSDVLRTAPSAPSGFLRAIFDIEVPEGESLPFDENLLATNPVPAVWLTSNIASLPDDTIASFVFHAPLKKATREAQDLAIRERLEKPRLSETATAEIMRLDGVSSAQLESAVKASRLVSGTNKGERDGAIVQAIRRSQRALSRELPSPT